MKGFWFPTPPKPDEYWDALPPEQNEKWPNGMKVFIIPLPGMTTEEKEAEVEKVLKWLRFEDTKLSGSGLEVVWREEKDSKIEFIVNPKEPWDDYVAQRMALINLKLRQLENRSMGLPEFRAL